MFEWWSLAGAWYARRCGRNTAPVAQVRRTGSRKAGAVWYWWAYGHGTGSATTLQVARQQVEQALTTEGTDR